MAAQGTRPSQPHGRLHRVTVAIALFVSGTRAIFVAADNDVRTASLKEVTRRHSGIEEREDLEGEIGIRVDEVLLEDVAVEELLPLHGQSLRAVSAASQGEEDLKTELRILPQEREDLLL